MREAVIVSGVRTPVGKFGGSLRDVSAPKLGSIVIREALRRAGVGPEEVDEVMMGNVISAGLGQNPARQSAILAGVPVEVGALTINKVCGSGLKSVMLAAQAIKVGDADIIVAGGMESMSQAPFLIKEMRWGHRFGDTEVVDAMIYDGLWDVFNDFHMLMTGEIIAEKYGVSRREADEFALSSHQKAVVAIRNGEFKDEIVPIETQGKRGEKEVFEVDGGVREDTSLEKLARLKPVVKENGILTAGNASQLSDGAAALVVMTREKAVDMGLNPLATIRAYSTGGVEPQYVMEAPIPTTRKLLEKTGLTIDDMDLIEHNEAFAPASIVVSRELGIDPSKFNVKGGAVAMGHPIGCSGARVLVTLLYALKQRSLRRGLATLCLGGGNAVAMIVER
jgi:acetyl-CoA C-acetyltransferase